MPQTKVQNIVYTVIMAIIMVSSDTEAGLFLYRAYSTMGQVQVISS